MILISSKAGIACRLTQIWSKTFLSSQFPDWSVKAHNNNRAGSISATTSIISLSDGMHLLNTHWLRIFPISHSPAVPVHNSLAYSKTAHYLSHPLMTVVVCGVAFSMYKCTHIG